MVSSNLISTLIIILIVVVYIGAIMILIGYICAVSPNLITTPSFSYLRFILLLLLTSFFIGSIGSHYGLEGFKEGTLLDFFFSD